MRTQEAPSVCLKAAGNHSEVLKGEGVSGSFQVQLHYNQYFYINQSEIDEPAASEVARLSFVACWFGAQ